MSLYDVSDFTKINYLPGLNNQLENQKGTLLGLLPKEPIQIEGRTTRVKLTVGDSLGQGSIAEGGDFSTPVDPAYDEATLELSRLNHAIGFTMEEMDLLRGKKAAARDVVEEKMDRARAAMQRDIMRQAWMDGSGVLANVASDSTPDITMDAVATVQVDQDRNIWVEPGRMLYDVVHGTTGAQQVTGFKVLSSTGTVLTTDSTTTPATSDGVIVRSGNWASGGAFRSLEFDGLLAAIDDGNNYLGIDRATVPEWRSTVLDASGTARTLTEELIHTLVNTMARYADDGMQPGGDSHCAIGSHGVWTAYHQIMTPGLRYTVSGETPDIGWGKGLEMLGIPLYKDIHAPRRNIFAFRKDSIKFVHAKHDDRGLLKFVEGGNGIFHLANASSGVGHSAQWRAYLTGMIGMATVRPRDHGRLADITEVGVAAGY